MRAEEKRKERKIKKENFINRGLYSLSIHSLFILDPLFTWFFETVPFLSFSLYSLLFFICTSLHPWQVYKRGKNSWLWGYLWNWILIYTGNDLEARNTWPKAQCQPGKKRKQEQELSNNPHTIRGCELLVTKNNKEKALIQWKNNDWAAFVAACLKLQASHAWKEATA